MDLGLRGRGALVLGASRGLGRAIAEALLAEGANVAIASSSRERIETTAREIGALPFVHDNSDIAGAAGLVEQATARLGSLDILVTNTGGPPASADPLAQPADVWEEAYRSLVLAPLAVVEAALPAMRAAGFGRIVNVSSTTVREPAAALVLSNSHRAATLALFKTLAREVAGDGVTLNTVLAGRIATDRLAQLYGSAEAAARAAAEEVPAGRLGMPQEFAAAVAFLCSGAAAYVTGCALAVDGGLTRSI
jgi:3-oxoacyl-[acyl-carrier protein] reductase